MAAFRVGQPLWHWPTTLSLDAVVVALAWQHAFAAAAGFTLLAPHRVLLATPIWMLWTWDRLVDAYLMDPIAVMTPRHRFARRHAVSLAGLIAAVLLASLLLAAWTLSSIEIACGGALVAASGLYFARIAVASTGDSRPLHKELGLMVMFCAAVTLFLWANAAFPSGLTPSLIVFAGLVVCNVLVISTRERAIDAVQGQPGLVSVHPKLAPWAIGLPLLCMFGAIGGALSLPGGAPLWLALVGSAGALAALAVVAPRVSSEAVRTLADAALATPPLVAAAW